MSSILVTLALAQVVLSPASPEGPIFSSPSLGSSFAFFEFAPGNGRGMTAPCACANPTGVRGEALVFQRTGSAWCSKVGWATTGIQNGDLVECTSTDTARVELSSGAFGLRWESAGTNAIPRSIEIDNAAWLSSASGTGNPTVTANAGTAPDGTLTADRVQVPATAATQYSMKYQGVAACSSVTCTVSAYVRGFSGSGSIDICTWGTGGTPGTGCTACPYVSTEWRRCSATLANTTPAYILIGSDSSGARPTHGAEDVLVWQAMAEVSPYVTSPVTTAAASATRNGELIGFTKSIPTTAGICLAATVETPSTLAFAAGAGAWAPVVHSGAATANSVAPYIWPYTVSAGGALAIDGSTSASIPGFNPVLDNVTTLMRTRAFHTGALWGYSINGTQRTGSASTWNSPTYTSIKLFAQTTTVGAAIFTKVQVDPDWTRCTP